MSSIRRSILSAAVEGLWALHFAEQNFEAVPLLSLSFGGALLRVPAMIRWLVN